MLAVLDFEYPSLFCYTPNTTRAVTQLQTDTTAQMHFKLLQRANANTLWIYAYDSFNRYFVQPFVLKTILEATELTVFGLH
jgi:hypothetical protein